MLGRLIPRDQEFFALFNELATHLVTSARLVHELFEQPAQLPERVRAIKAVEHKADQLTLEINARIDRSFVTPIDPEDIHERSSRSRSSSTSSTAFTIRRIPSPRSWGLASSARSKPSCGRRSSTLPPLSPLAPPSRRPWAAA